MPPCRPPRPFSEHSGPSSKDQTVAVAALMTVVDVVADAIAAGAARAADATGGQAAICRRQNMPHRSLLIRGPVNRSRTNPLPLIINQ